MPFKGRSVSTTIWGLRGLAPWRSMRQRLMRALSAPYLAGAHAFCRPTGGSPTTPATEISLSRSRTSSLALHEPSLGGGGLRAHTAPGKMDLSLFPATSCAALCRHLPLVDNIDPTHRFCYRTVVLLWEHPSKALNNLFNIHHPSQAVPERNSGAPGLNSCRNPELVSPTAES